ncbi:unnamed protein product [Rotaria sp. Silwood2]|nr:unnamed protein product [Rotaria sp. Silwood2]
MSEETGEDCVRFLLYGALADLHTIVFALKYPYDLPPFSGSDSRLDEHHILNEPFAVVTDSATNRENSQVLEGTRQAKASSLTPLNL